MSYPLGQRFERLGRLPPRLVTAGILLVGMIAFLPGLGHPPFYHLVEGDQALVVRAIYEGDWLVPKLNGDTLPSKPPLFNWLGALASLVAGDVTEGTVRFPSAIVSAITLAIVGTLGRRMFGGPAGIVAALFLLTTPTFAKQAREATTDGVLSFCLVSAFALFYAMYDRHEWTGWRRRAFFLSVAAAVMTKGPVGFALPALAIGAFLAIEQDLDPVRRLLTGPDKWLAVLPPLAWYGAATISAGHAFVEKQFLDENYRRFVGGFGLPKPVTTLIIPSLVEAAPWSFLFVIEIVVLTATRSWTSASRYLLCWWTAVLALFSLSVGKRTIYLVPLYPAAALLAADRAWCWVEATAADRTQETRAIGRRGWLVATGMTVLALMIVAATRLRGSERRPSNDDWDEGMEIVRFLLAHHAIAAAIMLAVGIALAVFYVSLFPEIRARHKQLRGVKQFGLEVARLVPREEPIYFYRYGSIELPGYLYFYVGRPIPRAPCVKFPHGCPAGYYLMWQRDWHEDHVTSSVGATLEARSSDTALWPRYPPFVLVRLPER